MISERTAQGRASLITLATFGLAIVLGCKGEESARPTEKPAAEVKPLRVRMETNYGTMVIELEREKAPITVDNFLAYVDDKFFDGTIIHRIAKVGIHVLQGGGFEEGMRHKPTRPPIRNESNNGLKNVRGTISMARTRDLHSATSQFFINVADNPALDYPSQGGYCVFGKVIEGLDVVDKIGNAIPNNQTMYDGPPNETIRIISATRM